MPVDVAGSAASDSCTANKRQGIAKLFSTARVFVWVLAAGLFSMAVRNSIDPDIWWHLRAGELIVDNHAVPHTDPFSSTRNGSRWIAHEWLSEVLLYGLYREGRLGLLTVVFGVVIAAAFVIAFMRCAGWPYIAGMVTVLCAIATIPTWGVRPQVLSLLLTSIFLLVLDRSEKNAKLLWWLPLLTLFWVNLHGAFALGIGLVFFYALGAAIEWLGGKARASGVTRVRDLAAALCGCVLVVPLNPNGLRMYSYPLETLRSRALQSYISEWRAPDFHLGRFYALAAVLVLTFVVLMFSRRRPRVHELFLVTLTALGALHSVRHIPIFVLVAAPLISERLQNWFASWSAMRGIAFPKGGTTIQAALLNTVLLLLATVFLGLHVSTTIRHLGETEKKDFPAGAAAFLALHAVPQPMLNCYDWGGYLIWRLYPEYLVWVDGRTDLYGDRFMDEYMGVSSAKEGWKLELERAGIRSVIFPANSPLVRKLLQDADWQQQYRDEQAVVVAHISN
jgi:hypothetical protein